MRKIVWCLLAIGAAAAPVRVQEAVALFSDDFSRFPPGVLSAPIGQLNGAIQEYHYIEHRGVRPFPWRNPIVHLDSWAAGDEGSEPYLEQHLINDDLRFSPLFVTGDQEWRDYRVEVLVKPLSLEGGMIDRELRRVVMFADDGHPDLASAVRDLTGDQRDEIVLWDQQRVWIYTQDRQFSGGRVSAPVRNPHYNDSNYRATVSLPAWAPARRGR